MVDGDKSLSERVIYATADVRDEDPMELPPLEETISADALDYLFHREAHPPGAYTVFPYCDLWVVAHSNGTVDLFETYHATAEAGTLPEDVPEPSTDDRMVVVHFGDEEYTFSDDQLDTLHEIIKSADDGDEAWEETIGFARQEVKG